MSIAREYTSMLRARTARQASRTAPGRDGGTARGGEGGSAHPDAAERRWRIHRWPVGFGQWQAVDPTCPTEDDDAAECTCHEDFDTHAAALAYVNDQIRADALEAIQNAGYHYAVLGDGTVIENPALKPPPPPFSRGGWIPNNAHPGIEEPPC